MDHQLAANGKLKDYIAKLKGPIYIPDKTDDIDRKLADFMNHYPDRSKLKIMFMRESEGVYQFGSRRVSVKVDRDKILIKVGGGYLSIDEFLDQYTPAELAHLDRRDPQKKFFEKVAIQKTVGEKSGFEVSPIRKTPQSTKNRRGGGPAMGRSPLKIAI